MPIEITMPRLSDTMEEGTLVKWRVKVGDAVKADQHIADVETDKATMELNVFDDGTVAKLAVDEGGTVPVGSLICVLAESGESVEDAAKAAGAAAGSGGSKKKQQAGESKPNSDSSSATSVAEPLASSNGNASCNGTSGGTSGATSGGGRLRVSPLARKLAQDAGLDLASIEGTGPDGRIIKRDVLTAIEGGNTTQQAPAPGISPKASGPSGPVPTAPSALVSKTVTLTNMRKTIAKRLVESKTTVPHFQVSVAIDMDPLMSLRETINAQLESQGVKLSVNDFITKAIALAAVQHPEINTSWTANEIVYHGTVNVGVAISLPPEKGGGLVVATLRDVHNKGLRAISDEVKKLAKKAREQGLSIQEMSDSTITLSNLGMPQYGVVQFNPIVNPPNAAIIGVGAALQRPMVKKINGKPELVIGHEMIATLSGDHRVIDGALGAEYLTTLRRLLENPAALLV